MAGTKRGKQAPSRRGLSTVHPGAAGVDVGATFHVVAVPPKRAADAVRTFRSFTGDLHQLADWLAEVRVTTVAMESTGVYWIPVYEILEARGFEVLLVNARDVKHVPGRKTDVNDAQWLQQLHAHGLLRGSFRPHERVIRLRALLRHRERLVQQAAMHIQHMQKALMQMNVQLHHVVSDITGLTGMRMLRAIVAGTHEPAALAQHRDPHCKQSLETIQEALTGNYRPEHLFALRQALELYDFLQTKVGESDGEIEAVLRQLNERRTPPAAPLPAARSEGSANEPKFDVRGALYTFLGADLSQIHGLGPYTVLRLVSECGDDMSRWPTAKHFTSWLTLAPGSPQLADAPFRQPRRRGAADGRGQRRPHPDRARGVPPPSGRPRRQGQGGHRHRPEASGAVLWRTALRPCLPGSWCQRLRTAVPPARGTQPAPPRPSARVQARRGHHDRQRRSSLGNLRAPLTPPVARGTPRGVRWRR
jgi:transposase